jgi:class 3 adenylate cyclase
VAESVELATILLSDLVGSTRLPISVGPMRADQLREEHFALLRDAIAGCGGEEVENTGDGLMVAFSSASGAVKCTVAVQRLLERGHRGLMISPSWLSAGRPRLPRSGSRRRRPVAARS